MFMLMRRGLSAPWCTGPRGRELHIPSACVLHSCGSGGKTRAPRDSRAFVPVGQAWLRPSPTIFHLFLLAGKSKALVSSRVRVAGPVPSTVAAARHAGGRGHDPWARDLGGDHCCLIPPVPPAAGTKVHALNLVLLKIPVSGFGPSPEAEVTDTVCLSHGDV